MIIKSSSDRADDHMVMKLRLNRSLEDVPPLSTDDELLEWAASLRSPLSEAVVGDPPVIVLDRGGRVSDEELFADIYERAAAVCSANPA